MDPKEILARLERRLDRMDEKLDDVARKQVAHTVSLDEHMRRTELAEEAVSVLADRLQPVTTHVAVVGALAKVLGAAGTVVGIVVGIAKLAGG